MDKADAYRIQFLLCVIIILMSDNYWGFWVIPMCIFGVLAILEETTNEPG